MLVSDIQFTWWSIFSIVNNIQRNQPHVLSKKTMHASPHSDPLSETMQTYPVESRRPGIEPESLLSQDWDLLNKPRRSIMYNRNDWNGRNHTELNAN